MLTRNLRHLIDEELKMLCKFTESLSRGDLIKHDQIEQLTGLRRGVAPWGKLIKKWKQWAIDKRRISVCAVPGVGYRLNTEQEQISHALRLEKQGVKRTLEGGLIAGVIERGELDEAMQELQQSIVNNSAAARKGFNEMIAERRSLLTKREALPRVTMSGVR